MARGYLVLKQYRRARPVQRVEMSDPAQCCAVSRQCGSGEAGLFEGKTRGHPAAGHRDSGDLPILRSCQVRAVDEQRHAINGAADARSDEPVILAVVPMTMVEVDT